jgi:hypothetical protein
MTAPRLLGILVTAPSAVIDSEHIVHLLLADALPSLGERARAEIERLVRNYERLARDWMDAGASPAEVRRDFERAVVDGLQETAHDLSWDTSWPACPRHLRHPLWYDALEHAWCCGQDGVTIARLGRLAELNPQVS